MHDQSKSKTELISELEQLRRRVSELEACAQGSEHLASALRECEERFRVISASTSDNLIVQDRNLIYTFVLNSQLGFSAEDMLGKSDADILCQEDAAQLTALKRQVIDTAQAIRVETSLVSKTGQKGFFEGNCFPKLDATGNVDGIIGYFENTTERELAHRRLLEREERLKTLGDNIPNGALYELVAPLDGRNHYTYLSDSIEQIFGVPAAEVLVDPTHFWALIVEEDRPKIDAIQAQSARDLTVFDCEFRQRTIHGETRWLHARSQPRRLVDGSTVWDGVVTDITDRKRAEKALQESQDRLLEAQHIGHIGNWVWNLRTSEVQWSSEIYVMHGMTEDVSPLTPDTFVQLVHADDRARVEVAISKAVSDGSPADLEYRIVRPDGSIRVIHAMGRVTEFDAEGRPLLMLGTNQDVTSRWQAEAELHRRLELQDQLAKVAATAPGMICSFRLRRDGSICMPFATPTIDELFGLRLEDVYDDLAPALALIHPDDVAGWREHMAESARSMSPWNETYRVLHPRKGERWLEVHFVPRGEEDGSILWHGVVQDVTERKQSEEFLQIQHSMAAALADAVNLEAALGICLQKALEATHLDCGGFYLTDEHTDALLLKAHRGLSAAFIADVSRFDVGSAQVNVVKAGKPVVACFDQYGFQRSAAEVQEGLRLLAVIPLIYEGRVIGCLNAASHTRNDLAPEQRQALEIIAASTTQAVVRLQAQATLRESEGWFRSWVEGAPDGILVQRDGVFVFVNPEMQRILGNTHAEELLGTSIMERIAPESRNNILQRMRLQQKTGQVLPPMEQVLLRCDGTRVAVESSAVPVDYRGHQAHLVFIRDITARKTLELELRASEERYRTLVEASPDGVLLADLAGHVQMANPALATFLGLRHADEIVGRHMLDIVNAQQHEEAKAAIEQCVRGGYVTPFESQLYRTDGSVIETEISATLIRDAQGKPQFILGLARDITERKRAARALRMSEDRRLTSIALTQQLMWTADENGKVTEDIPHVRGFTGQTYEQAQGDGWLKAVHPDDMESVRRIWDRSIRTKSPCEFEFRLRRSDGVYRTFLTRGVPVLEVDGSIREWIGICIDITERRQNEERLASLRAEITHASRLAGLGTLAGGIAHEINQPLSIVATWAEIAAREIREKMPTTGGEALLAVERITEAMDRAGRIVRRVRDFARKSDKQITTAFVPEVIHEVLPIVEHIFRTRGVHLDLEFAPDTPPVHADRLQLQQVLLNLLRNAAEAMEDTAAELRRIRVSGTVRQDMLEIAVHDAGCGIPSSQRERLFQPFFTTKAEGLGLGLAICQDLIESHQGRIWVSPNPDRGTTFFFTLPIARDVSHHATESNDLHRR